MTGRDEALLIQYVGASETRKCARCRGNEKFCENMGSLDEPRVRIHLANLFPMETTHPNVESMVADATHLAAFSDQQFDVVFSNSVIARWRREYNTCRPHTARGYRPPAPETVPWSGPGDGNMLLGLT